jgi:hypothetical protein
VLVMYATFIIIAYLMNRHYVRQMRVNPPKEMIIVPLLSRRRNIYSTFSTFSNLISSDIS